MRRSRGRGDPSSPGAGKVASLATVDSLRLPFGLPSAVYLASLGCVALRAASGRLPRAAIRAGGRRDKERVMGALF